MSTARTPVDAIAAIGEILPPWWIILDWAFPTQSISKSAHVILTFTAWQSHQQKQTDPDETVVFVTYKSLDVQMTSA